MKNLCEIYSSGVYPGRYLWNDTTKRLVRVVVACQEDGESHLSVEMIDFSCRENTKFGEGGHIQVASIVDAISLEDMQCLLETDDLSEWELLETRPELLEKVKEVL